MPVYRVFQSCSYDTAGQTFLMRCIDYATALLVRETTQTGEVNFLSCEHHSERTGA